MAYKAKDRTDLLSGIDEFLDQVTVLPPGEWDPTIRIEPPKNVPSQVSHALASVEVELYIDKLWIINLCLEIPLGGVDSRVSGQSPYEPKAGW